MESMHHSTTGRRPTSWAEPLLVSPRDAWRMLGCGNTHGYALLKAGELQSFLDGRSRKITVASIHGYVARKLEQISTESRRERPRKKREAADAL
jgi:hypothetical protein